VTTFRSGIARQLSQIDKYYSCCSTGKESKEKGNKDSIEKLSNKDEEEEVGLGDSSAYAEQESVRGEERDTRLDEEEREN